MIKNYIKQYCILRFNQTLFLEKSRGSLNLKMKSDMKGRHLQIFGPSQQPDFGDQSLSRNLKSKCWQFFFKMAHP